MAPTGPTCLDVGSEEGSRGRWGSWRVEEVFCRVARGFRIVLGWTVLVWVPGGREWSETSPLVGEAAHQLDMIAVAVVAVVVPVGDAAPLVGYLPCRQQQRLGQWSVEHVPTL